MAKLLVEDILACSGQVLAIDVETNGLHFWEHGLIGIGIHCPAANVSGYAHTCTYQDIDHGKPKKDKVWNGEKDYSASKRGKRVMVDSWTQPQVMTAIPNPIRTIPFLSAVHEIVKNPKTTLIGHNLKFDAHFLGLHLWELPCKIIDTTVLVHLLDSRMYKSLSEAEKIYLGTDSKRQHVTEAQKKVAKEPWNWGENVLEDYCTNDCAVTYQLAEKLMPKIRNDDLLGLLTIQMKYLRLLQKIEWRGIHIEEDFCHQAIAEFQANLIPMEQDLFEHCGKVFNWRSPQQLSQAIYENLGIAKPVNPFKDSYSAQAKMYTTAATGTPLLVKTKHPLASIVIDVRETAKLMDYAEKYLELRDDEGILHASFNITGTVTGRLSSSDPNLQNLPSANRKYELESKYTGGTLREGGYNLRQALCAKEGYSLVSIDHKQQEARLLAILAQEPVLLGYMRERKDIHLGIAISIWGDCGPELNKVHRDWSKATVFGLTYGMSEESLQEHFDKHGIQANGVEVKDQFFGTFPGLQPWFEKIMRITVENGYIRYWSGRYWMPEKPGEEYKAINAVIQGGAGDFLQVVAVRANQVLEKQNWGYMISIIHDEILFEIENSFVSMASMVLSRVMEGEDIFGVPYVTDVEVGDSYGTLKPFAMPADLSSINWQDYV